jgi:serine protease Do
LKKIDLLLFVMGDKKMQTNVARKKVAIKSFLMISTVILLLGSAPMQAFAEQDSIAMLRQMGKAFASIAEKASPAVVAVKSERTITRQSEPLDDILPYLFGPNTRGRQQQPRQYREQQTAQGSGFIISSDGYILTNNHMVEEATKVNVELVDGRKFTAKTVGTEPDSDVAVLKIDATDLPFIEMANSDTLEVGEWVLAIGNPYTFSHTVTAGIVSAKSRSGLGLAELENFIQTDAAINLGNSGGPLLNLDGKAVGMNTAIVSSESPLSGATGNIGIGFAIPINMAKYAYEQIKENGKVERGALGVKIQDLSPDNAESVGLKKNTKGVMIPEVSKNSPAEKAGLTNKDIILEVDGKIVESASDLQNRISMLKPGTKVELTIWRDSKSIKVPVVLGSRSTLTAAAESGPATIEGIGLTVQELTAELAKQFGYDGLSGVVVSDVKDGSPAASARIPVGALIIRVNRTDIKTVKDFNQEIEKAKQQGLTNAMLYVNYNGVKTFVTLPLK